MLTVTAVEIKPAVEFLLVRFKNPNGIHNFPTLLYSKTRKNKTITHPSPSTVTVVVQCSDSAYMEHFVMALCTEQQQLGYTPWDAFIIGQHDIA